MSSFGGIADIVKAVVNPINAAVEFGAKQAGAPSSATQNINPIGEAAVVGGEKAGALPSPGASKPSPTPVPSGPATRPDVQNFSNYLGTGQPATPQGVSFGAGATAEQQRSQIATGGTAGNTGAYTTPEVARFYRDLAIRTMTDETGKAKGSPLPVERQFMEQVFGQTPKDESTSSFLSALLRSEYGGQDAAPAAPSFADRLLS